MGGTPVKKVVWNFKRKFLVSTIAIKKRLSDIFGQPLFLQINGEV